ncbi:transcription initiation factor TFIID subunit 7-like isoform X2 [Heterocephalus glaber]|nr:transcription initiation factor TFIID subunit 7-like isoform X2 [Heterocephalus glaber]
MSKSQDELPPELESQFILRLPPEHASTVRNIIHSGSVNMNDKIKIDLSSDRRHAVIKVEDVSLSAKLVDLPCVIESLKTFDKKKFYKTADISQMLVCSADGDLPSSQEESVTSTDLSVTRNKERETEKKYIWKHGITPPLKNVRKKRLQKTQKKYIESRDVEKEVKTLLCLDAEAVSGRWEVIADEETKEIESQGFIPSFPAFPATSGYKQSDTSSEHDVVQEIFSDSSSSNHDNEDENEEQEDDDDDDEEEEEEEEEDDFEEVLERELQAKIIEYGQHETKEGASSIVMEIQKHIHYKEKKLQQIQNKAQRQKNIIRKVENLILKNHLKSVLENLAVQEKQKNDQITSLQEQLNHFLQK